MPTFDLVHPSNRFTSVNIGNKKKGTSRGFFRLLGRLSLDTSQSQLILTSTRSAHVYYTVIA
jgi:hypothetical protein